MSVYNVWSDTWSFPYQDSRESSIEGTKGSPPSHTSVGINNVFYTALKSTENKTQAVGDGIFLEWNSLPKTTLGSKKSHFIVVEVSIILIYGSHVL